MKFVHKKTGKVYTVVGSAIDCTNSRADTELVLYTDGEKWFVREPQEFFQKFDVYERAND